MMMGDDRGKGDGSEGKGDGSLLFLI